MKEKDFLELQSVEFGAKGESTNPKYVGNVLDDQRLTILDDAISKLEKVLK